MGRYSLYFLFIYFGIQATAQHSLEIDATLHPSQKTISITQKINYQNTSKDTLKEIYLFDWANSFSSKTSPLAKRFAENYESAFHFEKDENRGHTNLNLGSSIMFSDTRMKSNLSSKPPPAPAPNGLELMRVLCECIS